MARIKASHYSCLSYTACNGSLPFTKIPFLHIMSLHGLALFTTGLGIAYIYPLPSFLSGVYCAFMTFDTTNFLLLRYFWDRA